MAPAIGRVVHSPFRPRIGRMIALAAAILLTLLPHATFAEEAWPLSPASPNAIAITNLFWFIVAIAVVIFVGVEGALLYALIKFRRRPGIRAAQFHGSTRIEVLWTVIPALILAVVFYLTVRTMLDTRVPGGDPIRIHAIAHQWWWEFDYGGGITTANEINVPVNEVVIIELDSADVIHSFWAPQLAPKTDAIPNKTQQLWFNARQPGVFTAKCAEFCGLSHAWMYFHVNAVPTDEYQAWLRAQRSPPSVPSGLAAQGRQIYQAQTCGSCHTISGVSDGKVGPDLTHMGSRWTIGAGVLENTTDNMRLWLADPSGVKPGALMPNYHFSPDELSALTAYMESLK